MSSTIICDTTVWLYLGRVQQQELLNQLYNAVLVTEVVCLELDVGRLTRLETIDPRHLSWVHVVQADQSLVGDFPANELGPGELSTISYVYNNQSHIVGLDDLEARKFDLNLGLKVVGTPGLLLRAKHFGYLKSIRPILVQLKQGGFYISQSLFSHILALAGE